MSKTPPQQRTVRNQVTPKTAVSASNPTKTAKTKQKPNIGNESFAIEFESENKSDTKTSKSTSNSRRNSLNGVKDSTASTNNTTPIIYPPFPAEFETELFAPIPSDPALQFNPLQFVLTNFPHSSNNNLNNSSNNNDNKANGAGKNIIESKTANEYYNKYLSQLTRSINQLNKSVLIIQEDRSFYHESTNKSIETVIETIELVLEGVKAMTEFAEDQTSIETEQLQSMSRIRSHIVFTLRSLRNLHFLISAIDNLKFLADATQHVKQDYAVILKVLTTIYETFNLLKPYTSYSIIQSLKQTMNNIKTQLRNNIFLICYHVLPELNQQTNLNKIDFTQLAAALKIIDLYATNKDKEILIEWFVEIKLNPFYINYTGGMYSDIMNVQKMYSTLYQLLEDYIHHGYNSIFPLHWNIEAYYARKFVDCAIIIINKLLNDMTDRFDLYKPLKATVELEAMLQTKIKRINNMNNNNSVISNDTSNPHYERYFSYSGNLVSCFEPYLNIFIELEQTKLEKFLNKLDRDEQWIVEITEAKQCYPSLSLLFTQIKKSLEKYSALIHNETLFAITKEYKRVIANYIKLLELHIPNIVKYNSIINSTNNKAVNQNNSSNSLLDTGSSGTSSISHAAYGNMSKSEFESLIQILSTLQQLLNDLPELIQCIKSQLTPEFSEFVDWNNYLTEQANQTQLKATALLSSNILLKFEPVLSTLKETKKETYTPNHDSNFVHYIFTVLKREIPRLTHLNCFYAFLSQLVVKFIPIYLHYIKKLHKIEEGWATNLLSDTKNVKAFCTKLADPEYLKTLYLEESANAHPANVGNEENKQNIEPQPKTPTPATSAGDSSSNNNNNSTPSADYLLLLNSEFSKIERLLKVLTISNAKFIAAFKHYYPRGSAAMVGELMDLRGLTSGEQTKLVKAYNATQKEASKQIPLEHFSKNFMSNLVGDLKKQILY